MAVFAFFFSTARLHAQGGWAFSGGTVTGGAGGPAVTVTTLAQLTAAISDNNPRIVNVSGTINLGGSNVRFGSNKTIQGVGTNSGFIGNLKSVEVTNVIIRRLNFTNPNSVGDGDGLTLQVSTRIWVDHCSFNNCGDGSLDLTHATDFVTVSWCKFTYTVNNGHSFSNLIGHSDGNASEDAGTLRITFHHNWWSTGVVERMPRVRFGRVHSYNNYFNAPGNNYCIRASIQSQVLTEFNSFENIDSPQEKFAPNGLIRSRNNQYVNCTGVVEFNDNVFTPPYSYSPDPVANVKALVTAGAGTGGGGSVEPTPTPAAPSNLAANTVSSSQINLSWTDNASNESGFSVDRATNSTFSAGLVTSSVGANVSSFQATGLSVSTTYFFRVRASNNGGNSANSNTASATTQAGTGTGPLPAAPSNLSATVASSSQINLAWSDNANNETGFTVDRATNSAFSAGLTSSNVGANTTSFQANGLAANATYFFRVRANNGTGSSGNSATASATTSATGGTGNTITLVAVATEDGRIVESSESSNTGGSVDANGTSSSALRTGDDSSDRQLKSILSFDTSSIPDGATIVSAVIRLTRGSSSGTSPFTTHGACLVDIKGGNGFSNSVALQTGDFQAAADAAQVATMSAVSSEGAVSTGTVNATGRGLVNKTGKTQFRVYFATDDNDDGGNDYVGWFSANNSTAANRPVLEIVYQ